jgi:diadenosine tetraphosphate (Ap4A) HIT family hydrolase
MNTTVKKFGYSKNLIKEYDYWVVLYRPQQVTIGSLVLICKENKFNLGDLSKSAYVEFRLVIQDIEIFLYKKLGANKINYIALMMVDPHVHFHIIPRYSSKIIINEKLYNDIYWPKPPNVLDEIKINESEKLHIIKYFQNIF